MPNWIRGAGTISTGAVLLLTGLLYWSSTTKVDPSKLDTAIATSGNYNSAVVRNRQISSPRWIEIDLSEQRLRAWEGKKLIYSFRTSTGKRSTPTPVGTYRINSKYRAHRMRGRGYDVPNVPYTMYFYNGYAIHGAYWHNRFGTPVSHGCVNLPVRNARKLYRWASVGTRVVVRR
jgi:lipoprotein-anchoring transpeptidase ErfK/SrfK